MNFYQQIDIIFPYLVSIRKLENYLSIDTKIPKTWKLPKKYVDEKKVMEQPTDDQAFRVISFVSDFEESGINDLFNNIKGVINWNKEREEKEQLFNNKVLELKTFFDSQTLHSLKNLEFQIKKPIEVELEDEPR